VSPKLTSEETLVAYVICEMLTAEHTTELAKKLGVEVPPGKRREVATHLATKISFKSVHEFSVENWERPDTALHLRNLKSGLLTGNSWHGLAPSRLHLGLQGYVRRVARSEMSLGAYLEVGLDIARKEYLMVAIADLTEATLVEQCGATPPLKARSVSDAVMAGVPFDLKNGAVPSGWTAEKIRSHPARFAKAMFEQADKARERVQARTAFNEWADNRLYVVVEHDGRWLTEPEAVLVELAAACNERTDLLSVKVSSRTLQCRVVVL
jgi:hypothetical protein